MVKFRIGLYETVGGSVIIEAKTEAQARKKAQQILDDDGINGFPDFKPAHREVDVCDCNKE